ncbi:hypothetical protein ORM86_22725 [Bacillus cereus]|uniref:hypothetical protein n=1 Tax=Bacillus cereus TaxID=1396 RepID=UPI002ABFDF80|nr:hypothetical protein [Bacillus cereus]MDZ4486009.1 hypothetical protein [Bacillus cereus]
MNQETIVINIPPVEEWPLKQLKSVCRHNKIKGYTKMDREQLVKHVKEIIKNMKSMKGDMQDENI